MYRARTGAFEEPRAILQNFLEFPLAVFLRSLPFPFGNALR